MSVADHTARSGLAASAQPMGLDRDVTGLETTLPLVRRQQHADRRVDFIHAATAVADQERRGIGIASMMAGDVGIHAGHLIDQSASDQGIERPADGGWCYDAGKLCFGFEAGPCDTIAYHIDFTENLPRHRGPDLCRSGPLQSSNFLF